VNDELFREPEDSGYRFMVVFKDMHILRQWDITQQVVINQMIAVLRRHGEDHAEDTG